MRLCKGPRVAGIVPTNELDSRARKVRAVKLPSELGKVPVNEFENIRIVTRLVKYPTDEGMDPNILPDDIDNTDRDVY